MYFIDIIDQDSHRISVKIKGAPLQQSNLIRRACLSQVPIFAIDTVKFIENTTILSDEIIAHRLGLVPLRADPTRFTEAYECDCQAISDEVGKDQTDQMGNNRNAGGCEKCTVMLVMDVVNTRPFDNIEKTPQYIMSGNLISPDGLISPVWSNIPIGKLEAAQQIKLVCQARLGRGSEHAKWSAANISTLINTEREDELILTVESSGALEAVDILLAAINTLQEEERTKFGDALNHALNHSLGE